MPHTRQPSLVTGATSQHSRPFTSWYFMIPGTHFAFPKLRNLVIFAVFVVVIPLHGQCILGSSYSTRALPAGESPLLSITQITPNCSWQVSSADAWITF